MGLKCIEFYFGKPKAVLYGKEAGSESIEHKTRMMELEAFPDWHADWYTKCDCLKCNPPVPPKGPGGGSGPYKFEPRSERYERIVDGYVFMVPADIPREARAYYDFRTRTGHFHWYHPDGRVQSLRLMPRYEVEPMSFYSDQQVKPIMELKPKKAGYVDYDEALRQYKIGIKSNNELEHARTELERLIAHHRKELIRNSYVPAPRIGTEKAYK